MRGPLPREYTCITIFVCITSQMSHLPLKFMPLGKITTSEGKLVTPIGLLDINQDFSNNLIRSLFSVG